jgi:hypothetical protein
MSSIPPNDAAIVADAVRQRLVAVEAACRTITSTRRFEAAVATDSIPFLYGWWRGNQGASRRSVPTWHSHMLPRCMDLRKANIT